MSDKFDYLAWRGDLTLAQAPFNELDGVILARFAYVPFEYFARPLPRRFVTIRDMADEALADQALVRDERWKLRDRQLLQAMADSARFGPLEAGFQESLLDEVLQTQFSAICVRLDADLTAVLFRGTDNTVIGWKEDLNMSYLSPVPGQKLAAEYLRRAAEKLGGRLILCGHSKGGNLAVYAAAFCGADVQARIDAVYNYDGPGFYDSILDTEGYKAICGRIHTFVPQFSVVGMLLGHPESHTVVHSTETGLQQHDTYSWQMLGPRFAALEQVTGGSQFLDSTIKDWTADMTAEQFEVFVDAIYQVLSSPELDTMRQMRENWFSTGVSFLRSVADMDEQTRAAAAEAIKLLARSAGREAVEALTGA